MSQTRKILKQQHAALHSAEWTPDDLNKLSVALSSNQIIAAILIKEGDDEDVRKESIIKKSEILLVKRSYINQLVKKNLKVYIKEDKIEKLFHRPFKNLFSFMDQLIVKAPESNFTWWPDAYQTYESFSIDHSKRTETAILTNNKLEKGQ